MLVPPVCPCVPMDLISQSRGENLETAPHGADSTLGGLPSRNQNLLTQAVTPGLPANEGDHSLHSLI